MWRDPLSRRALGILVVLVMAAAAVALGRGVGADGAGTPVALTIESVVGQRSFTPSSARVPVGSAVRLSFRNRSAEAHNLTFLAPLAVGSDTIVEPGREHLIEFAAPPRGSYQFVCTIHPGMAGVLSVR